jgi:hypothetical protein
VHYPSVKVQVVKTTRDFSNSIEFESESNQLVGLLADLSFIRSSTW